jgi:hypothetical protein
LKTETVIDITTKLVYFALSDKKVKKSKAVPLHAMVALGGRDIAPTHS